MVRKLQEAYEQRGIIINKNKSEYLIFENNEKEDLPLEDICVSGEDKCKYMGALFTKDGCSNEDINNRANKGRNVIRSVNSVLWNESLRTVTKKRMYKAVAQSVVI
jgi:hypothetical protein